MSEDLTRQLPDDTLTQILGAVRELGARMESFERRMDAFEGRMENLARKVDERLYDTRPIWEQVLAEVKELRQAQVRLSHEFEDGWRRFERKLRAMSDSWLELKADYSYLDRRLGELEEPQA